MEKNQKLYSVSQLYDLKQADIQSKINDWLIMSRLLLEPDMMLINGKEQVFDLRLLQQVIADFGMKEDFWLQLKNAEEETTIHVLGDTLFEKCIINKKNFYYWENVYLDYLKSRLIEHGFFAYIRSYEEYLYHNTSELSKRRSFETADETNALPMMKGLNGDIVVDCNVFPGYDVFYKGVCLTACWWLFLGEPYKKLFARQLLLDIQQVERVAELGSGVFFELHKDPFQWQEEANLKFQQLFRDQLGISQLSYTNGVGLLKQPYIEFAFEDTVIQTVQYQNDQFQPTEKSDASYFVTRTYNFLTNQYRVNRMKGGLNALAYFPWIDDESERMMNYHILYPELTLDKGLAAFEYYIRDSIEFEIQDMRYKEYTAVLQLFIPKKAFLDFPLEELKLALKDMTIHQVSRKNDSLTFSLEKEAKHLIVSFIDQKKVSAKNQLDILEI
ncbi:hypothetical protein G15_1666 [Enterococcus avium]|uniref:hypothetical protein n=1 Tax=Enterococcus malodoratus TaxID=71451 RepID=UPI0008BDFB1D|nr:hypothetical protein [Enterococcus malodoratus]BBM18002.1 hypothetical protein G15_1666 [Enterococcus avium]SET04655.1 hypothetical protein SAMN04487821_105143 [Enterococcus malodoratus]